MQVIFCPPIIPLDHRRLFSLGHLTEFAIKQHLKCDSSPIDVRSWKSFDRAPVLGLRWYLMNSDSSAMVFALARPGLVLDVFITLILL